MTQVRIGANEPVGFLEGKTVVLAVKGKASVSFEGMCVYLPEEAFIFIYCTLFEERNACHVTVVLAKCEF